MKKTNIFSTKVLACTMALSVCLMSVSLPAISNNNDNLGVANNYSTMNTSKTSTVAAAKIVAAAKAVWNGSCREAVYFAINVGTALLGSMEYEEQISQQVTVEKSTRMKGLN